IDAHTSDGTLRLTLVNTPAAVDAARRALEQYLAPHALTQVARFNVELVLEETLMNLIHHAFDQPGQATIELSVNIAPDEITLRFEDTGIAFDPRDVPAPTRPTSLADVVPGGLGLMLVRKRARSLHYERRGSRNCVTVTVARHPSSN